MFLGEKNGIKYYDDSISTICETTIQALNTLKDVDAVLIGGMDRGIDYSELIHFLSGHPVPYIILMEATGKRIFEEIRQDYPDFQKMERLILTDHFERCSKRSAKTYKTGPQLFNVSGTASYGIFKNFEERGEVFARLVLK